MAAGAEPTELTVAEAAHVAGVSDRTIRNWINSGELPAKSEPGGRKVHKQVLLAYLEQKGYAPPPVETSRLFMSNGNGHAEGLAGTEDLDSGAAPTTETSATPAIAAAPATLDIIKPLVDQLQQERARVDKLHRENLELAGRVGFLQARVMECESRLLAANAESAEVVEAEETDQPEVPLPWWKRLFGAL